MSSGRIGADSFAETFAGSGGFGLGPRSPALSVRVLPCPQVQFWPQARRSSAGTGASAFSAGGLISGAGVGRAVPRVARREAKRRAWAKTAGRSSGLASAVPGRKILEVCVRTIGAVFLSLSLSFAFGGGNGGGSAGLAEGFSDSTNAGAFATTAARRRREQPWPARADGEGGKFFLRLLVGFVHHRGRQIERVGGRQRNRRRIQGRDPPFPRALETRAGAAAPAGVRRKACPWPRPGRAEAHAAWASAGAVTLGFA